MYLACNVSIIHRFSCTYSYFVATSTSCVLIPILYPAKLFSLIHSLAFRSKLETVFDCAIDKIHA